MGEVNNFRRSIAFETLIAFFVSKLTFDPCRNERRDDGRVVHVNGRLTWVDERSNDDYQQFVQFVLQAVVLLCAVS